MPKSDISTTPRDGSYVFDDFFANSQVGDAALAKLNWEIIKVGNDSSLAYVASQNGILRITTASTADGDGEAISLAPDGVTLGGTNQEFWFRASFPDISGNLLVGNNFRIGFNDLVTTSAPNVGVWVDSNSGLLELDVASTHGDWNDAVTGISTLTGGTTMVKGTTYDFHVIMDGTNTNGGPARVRLFVDGELGATVERVLLGSTETTEFSIIHWQDTGGADSLELDIDYIEYWLPRN